jgi:stress response protein YsnF
MNMENPTTDRSDPISKPKSKNVKHLLEKLRSKVKNFDVVDPQGKAIAKVKDLIVNSNRQLNFVIAKISHSNETHPFLLLNGKLVQKIEPKNKCVFTRIDELQLTQLPEYVERENTVSNMTDNLNFQQPIDYKGNSATTENPQVTHHTESEFVEEIEEDIIRLLGERLVVGRSKRKIGDVIIRKEIETRMIQIPVRREKLIIEQPGIEPKQLAEIDLGEEEISQDEFGQANSIVSSDMSGGLTVTGEFDSPKIASLILNAIQLEQNHGCKKIRVSILVEDEENQQKYQEWFNRTSKA